MNSCTPWLATISQPGSISPRALRCLVVMLMMPRTRVTTALEQIATGVLITTCMYVGIVLLWQGAARLPQLALLLLIVALGLRAFSQLFFDAIVNLLVGRYAPHEPRVTTPQLKAVLEGAKHILRRLVSGC